MSPNTRSILAAAVALIACRAAIHPGTATVVRDGKSAPSNPAIEAGGHKLGIGQNDRQPSIVIQYNLTGAGTGFYPWFSPCLAWPWSMFNAFGWNRHGLAAPPIPPGDSRFPAGSFRPLAR